MARSVSLLSGTPILSPKAFSFERHGSSLTKSNTSSSRPSPLQVWHPAGTYSIRKFTMVLPTTWTTTHLLQRQLLLVHILMASYVFQNSTPDNTLNVALQMKTGDWGPSAFLRNLIATVDIFTATIDRPPGADDLRVSYSIFPEVLYDGFQWRIHALSTMGGPPVVLRNDPNTSGFWIGRIELLALCLGHRWRVD